MNQPTRVFIGLPCGELSRFSGFWRSREALDLTGLEVQAGQAQGLYIDNNQNIAVRNMMKLEEETGKRFDYFWLLNDDMMIPPDTLQKLIKHQKDVVVPLLVGHEIPHEPLFYDYREGDDYRHKFLEPGDRGLVRGVGSGGGGMLIARHVFDAIPDPWWENHMVYSGGRPPIKSTEDFDFCRKVEDAGFEIWCDLDCPIGHGTIFNVWPVRLHDGSWGTSYERHGKHVIIPAALNPETNPNPIEEMVSR